MNNCNKEINMIIIGNKYSKREFELFECVSIPKFYTLDMLKYCSMRLGIDYEKEMINRFCVASFISKRIIVLENRKEDCYVIHDSMKSNFLSNNTDYNKFCRILIDFYNNKISDIFYERIFKNDLLKCQIKIGYLLDWRKEYQLNSFQNNSAECNTLIEMLAKESDYNDDELQWIDYYIEYNNYLTNREITEELIEHLKSVLKKDHHSNNDAFFFLLFLLVYLLMQNKDYQLSEKYLEEILLEINKVSNDRNYYVYYLCQLIDISYLYIITNENDKLTRILIEINKTIERLDSLRNSQLIIAAKKTIGIIYQHQYEYDLALSTFISILLEDKSIDIQLDTPMFIDDKFSLYDRIGELFIKQGKYGEAIVYYELAIKKQQLSKNDISLAWSHYHLGRTFYLYGNLLLSEQHLMESILLFEAKNSNSKAYSYGELSYVYQYKGEMEKSIKMLKKSIFILINSNEIEDGVFYLNHLGRLYQSQGFLELSKRIFELCIDFIILTKRKKNLGWIYNNYARNFLFENDNYKAMDYFSTANQCFEKDHDLLGNIYIENNIGEVLLKLDKYNDAYKNLMSSLQNKKEIEDQHAICYTYREISEYYLKINDFYNAQKYIELAYNLCSCCNFRMLAGDIYLTKGKLEYKQGNKIKAAMNYTKAYNYFEQQNFITRMIFCLKLKSDTIENPKEKLVNRLLISLLRIKLMKEEEYLTNQTTPIFLRIMNEIEKMKNGEE